MIVALTGQKGGVGKSTLSVCLAAEALARGLAVLLVDADPQGTARTWAAVAAEQGHPTPTIVAMGAGMHRPDQLPRLAGNFDLTIIDCPPRADDVQHSALMIANLALLPCGPAAFDAWALTSSFQIIGAARALRPQLDAAVVLTRKRRATALGQSARDVLTAGELPVLAAEIHDRVAYQEATAAGQAVSLYAPRSEAAGEISAVLDEVMARLAPPTAPSVSGKQRAASSATSKATGKAKPKAKAASKGRGR